MKLKLLFVLAALALIACGEDTETLRVTDRYTLDMLGKGVSLTEEKCDSARTGQLLYVSDSTGIFYCTGKVWKKVNGEDGKDGRDGKDAKDGTDGKKGENGASGTDCFVEEFADGFVLGCGATKAIVRYNFEIPDTCRIELKSDLSYELICGADSAKLDRGPQGDAGDVCKQEDIGGGQVRLICGQDSVTLFKAACGETPFDPDGLQFCYGDTLVDRCGTRVYDIKKQFCYGDSLVPLCGGEEYDPEEQFCFNGVLKDFCGGEKYNPKEFSCKDNELYGKCGEQAYRVKNEFCDDRDGAIYRFTVIGGATWMAQNLDYKVPQSFCDSVQKDDDLHCGIKGRFYPWTVAMGKEWSECGTRHSCGSTIQYPHQGVCPDGWHIPTIEEWGALRDVMGTYDIVYWDESVVLRNRKDMSEVLKNEFGFSAIPTGIVDVYWSANSFIRRGDTTIWSDGFDSWSSTEASAEKAELCFFYSIGGYKEMVSLEYPYTKESTRTIRCVKD